MNIKDLVIMQIKGTNKAALKKLYKSRLINTMSVLIDFLFNVK